MPFGTAADLAETLDCHQCVHTPEGVRSEHRAVKALASVYLDKGPHPEFHDDIKRQVQRRWPLLIDAIENLVGT